MSTTKITPDMLYDDAGEEVVEITKTPPEWAEALGVTGLKPEQWQARDKTYVPETRTYIAGGDIEWERQVSHVEFLRLLYSDWTFTNEHGVEYRKGKRTFRLPKVVITEGMVLDVLGEAQGWLPTSEIAWRIFEPMGVFFKNERQPVQKVRDVLNLLADQGLVIAPMDENGYWDDRYHRTYTEVRGEGSSKMWGRADLVEQWVADRDADDAEFRRRLDKLKKFLTDIQADASYTHHRRPAFVNGVIDTELDTASVQMRWTVLEEIIDIVNNNLDGG